VSNRVRRLLRLSDELESISDETATILKATRRLRKGGQDFSSQSRQALLDVHAIIAAFAETVSGLIKSPRPTFDLSALQVTSHDIGERIRSARRRQLDRVGPDDADSPIRVLAELDILNAYERIRSCYINIAETLAGGK
jgi:Na+/phosphate symporter